MILNLIVRSFGHRFKTPVACFIRTLRLVKLQSNITQRKLVTYELSRAVLLSLFHGFFQDCVPAMKTFQFYMGQKFQAQCYGDPNFKFYFLKSKLSSANSFGSVLDMSVPYLFGFEVCQQIILSTFNPKNFLHCLGDVSSQPVLLQINLTTGQSDLTL